MARRALGERGDEVVASGSDRSAGGAEVEGFKRWPWGVRGGGFSGFSGFSDGDGFSDGGGFGSGDGFGGGFSGVGRVAVAACSVARRSRPSTVCREWSKGFAGSSSGVVVPWLRGRTVERWIGAAGVLPRGGVSGAAGRIAGAVCGSDVVGSGSSCRTRGRVGHDGAGVSSGAVADVGSLAWRIAAGRGIAAARTGGIGARGWFGRTVTSAGAPWISDRWTGRTRTGSAPAGVWGAAVLDGWSGWRSIGCAAEMR